jgi:flagellar basal-body M-ring protein/flagellar hook-basal body protein fliF
MGGLLAKLKIWWETADRTQKTVTVFGSAFLVLLLGGTFYFASKPRMAIAFANLDSAEVGVVSDEITKLGIPVEYDTTGNVQVPVDKVAEVRAKLAQSGKLPSPGHMMADSAKDIGPATTSTVEQARLLTIQQDELASAIENIKGVSNANVQINLGDKSPFLDDSKPASASVEVSLDQNAMMDPDQGRAIAMLVSNAVTGLSPNNVFVLDNAGHPLYDGSHNAEGGASGNEKLQQEISEKTRRQRDLQEAMDNAFGRGNTRVVVNLDLDFDKTHTEDETHPPADSPSEKQTSTETMTGDGIAPNGGLAGLTSNSVTPKSPPAIGETSKRYESKTTDEVHPVDDMRTSKDIAQGGIRSMAITALLNINRVGPDGKPGAPLDAASQANFQKAVDQFLVGYLQPWQQDPKAGSRFTETSTIVAFDSSAQATAVQALKADASRDRMQTIISLLPVFALVFVGFLVAKAIGKAAKPGMLSALPGMGALALNHSEYARLNPGGVDGADGANYPPSGHQPEEIALIQEKLNVPLEQIKRMSDEKSENVAMLIKSWMMEDHK